MGRPKGMRMKDYYRQDARSPIALEKYYAFAAEYVKNGGKPVEACIAAGYSPASAKTQSKYLLARPQVRAKIIELSRARERAVGVDATWVLYQLVRLLQVDVRKLFNEDGTMKDIREMSDDEARLVASFEVEDVFFGRGRKKQRGRVRKVKLVDRLRVIEMVGRHINVGALREGPVANLTLVSQEDALAELVRLAQSKKPEPIAEHVLELEVIRDGDSSDPSDISGT